MPGREKRAKHMASAVLERGSRDKHHKHGEKKIERKDHKRLHTSSADGHIHDVMPVARCKDLEQGTARVCKRARAWCVCVVGGECGRHECETTEDVERLRAIDSLSPDRSPKVGKVCKAVVINGRFGNSGKQLHSWQQIGKEIGDWGGWGWMLWWFVVVLDFHKTCPHHTAIKQAHGEPTTAAM